MYKFSKFLILLFLISSVFAQTDEVVLLDSNSLLNPEVPNNNFDNLVSVNDLVYELRKTYGIKGSVALTKTMWQILISYSNQEQAQNTWQRAISKITQLDGNSYTEAVNFQFFSGLILSKDTHGMTMEKWINSSMGIHVDKHTINDFFSLNDDLTIYFYLKDVWTIILMDIQNQKTINWQDVIVDSLTLFQKAPKEEEINALTDEKEDQVAFEKVVFLAVKQWEKSDNDLSELADLMQAVETTKTVDMLFYKSMVRFSLNKHKQHYLASVLNWFEVVYHLYLRKSSMEEDVAHLVLAYVEEIDAWFLSQESELLSVNGNLPSIVADSTQHLKVHLQNNVADLESSAISTQLPIPYQLIEPMFDKYMLTPFRRQIRENLEVCLNISEEFAPYPQPPIDANQFNGCIDDMTAIVVLEAKSRELAGSLTKVDTKKALDRALQSPAWQIINILNARVAENNCLQDSDQSINPLEWTLAAESLLWFVDRWPAYFKSYPNNDKFQALIQQGKQLTQGFACVEQSALDMLKTDFSQIGQAWQNVKTQINQVVLEFNQLELMRGSDLDLLNNADKQSNYRVEDAVIEACDVQKVCGVHVALTPSRKLFSLFPNHLLVADQMKLGKLKLCYDNVGWDNRRSASTHLENPSVANYFGQFSFSIKGFYDDELVFERKLTGKTEYYYLFAANNEEVLNTYCPLALVGNKISTKLKRGTYGLLPNRLTFLTASRASETSIMKSNWSAGEEWQDLVASQEVIIVADNNLEELNASIQLSYQQLAKKLQDSIYQIILGRKSELTEKQQLLMEGFEDMQRMTKLFSHMAFLTLYHEYMTNDQLHGIVFGKGKIPDVQTIVEFYTNQLNIKQLILSIDDNMKINENKWNNLTSSWSYAYINNILYRLKSLQP